MAASDGQGPTTTVFRPPHLPTAAIAAVGPRGSHQVRRREEWALCVAFPGVSYVPGSLGAEAIRLLWAPSDPRSYAGLVSSDRRGALGQGVWGTAFRIDTPLAGRHNPPASACPETLRAGCGSPFGSTWHAGGDRRSERQRS